MLFNIQVRLMDEDSPAGLRFAAYLLEEAVRAWRHFLEDLRLVDTSFGASEETQSEARVADGRLEDASKELGDLACSEAVLG
jgi:hypothetical protein